MLGSWVGNQPQTHDTKVRNKIVKGGSTSLTHSIPCVFMLQSIHLTEKYNSKTPFNMRWLKEMDITWKIKKLLDTGNLWSAIMVFGVWAECGLSYVLSTSTEDAKSYRPHQSEPKTTSAENRLQSSKLESSIYLY